MTPFTINDFLVTGKRNCKKLGVVLGVTILFGVIAGILFIKPDHMVRVEMKIKPASLPAISDAVELARKLDTLTKDRDVIDALTNFLNQRGVVNSDSLHQKHEMNFFVSDPSRISLILKTSGVVSQDNFAQDIISFLNKSIRTRNDLQLEIFQYRFEEFRHLVNQLKSMQLEFLPSHLEDEMWKLYRELIVVSQSLPGQNGAISHEFKQIPTFPISSLVWSGMIQINEKLSSFEQQKELAEIDLQKLNLKLKNLRAKYSNLIKKVRAVYSPFDEESHKRISQVVKKLNLPAIRSQEMMPYFELANTRVVQFKSFEKYRIFFASVIIVALLFSIILCGYLSANPETS